MSAKRAKPGIGRGLSAILPEAAVEPKGSAAGPDAGGGLVEIDIDLIDPNPDQPRQRFDDETIAALAQSIGTAGVIQPLLVRPIDGGRYEIIAGERRYRASKAAGLKKLPAIVRDEDKATRMQTALIENVAREQLNPVDEAHACQMLIDDLGLPKKELGDRLGRSRVAISNLIRLLDLPDDVLELLAGGELSEGHGRALLRAPDHEDRRRLARQAAEEGWSVRETERRAGALAEGGGKPKREPARISADEQEALRNASDELEKALGTGVKLKSTPKGIRAEILFADFDELRDYINSRN